MWDLHRRINLCIEVRIFPPLNAFESPMKFLSGSITCKSGERGVSDIEARVRAGFLTVWLPYSMSRWFSEGFTHPPGSHLNTVWKPEGNQSPWNGIGNKIGWTMECFKCQDRKSGYYFEGTVRRVGKILIVFN